MFRHIVATKRRELISHLCPLDELQTKDSDANQSEKEKQAERLLELPPTSLKLRDALHPKLALSGRKKDMAIDAYTFGCHLYCHDDGISYWRVICILCLTDPDTPWKVEQRDALRLYPALARTSRKSEVHKIPSPDHKVSIPPMDHLHMG